MKKKAVPKWYEGEMTADAPVMKKDKMMYMHEDMDMEMDGEMGCEMDGMPDDHEHPMPMQMMLAHAYVPWQCYENAFSPCEALMKGTLFPELWGVYPIPE